MRRVPRFTHRIACCVVLACGGAIALADGPTPPAPPATPAPPGAAAAATPSAPATGWEATGPSFWIERQLELIRRDIPFPTVQARNLFHVSAAM
ncbi:MAG: hypothetical protein ACTS3F_12785, partial [Phycisphaerales bacterium]